ncbi:MAG: type I-U CRISPR-associated RAMP protein Csb1/Cas7u [Enhygromyxa sp.]
MPAKIDDKLLNRCANDPEGPVALHLCQHLVPVEGHGAPFFPPTFATDEKYNIDELMDGTRVALVDSVGAQANRMEPLFLRDPFRSLVPQVWIKYGDAESGTDGEVSLLEAGHRLGDAVIRCTELRDDAHAAFEALRRHDAGPIAKIAPTSLVFGAWDSRDTNAKVPRLVQSTIRAWNVSRLRRAAQFNPALDYAAVGIYEDEDSLDKSTKDNLTQRGFIHVPSTDQPGGIVAHGPIRRDVTVNLVALRRLDSKEDSEALRRYLLGLTLLAATQPIDPFLRQGCLLVPDADQPADWTLVDRNGTRTTVSINADGLLAWARSAAKAFGVGEDRDLTFDPKLGRADASTGNAKKASKKKAKKATGKKSGK